MAQTVPENFQDLFRKRAFGGLATLMPNGQPQVTPMWCDYDGKHLLLNTAKGRQKEKNMRRDPRISLCIQDPDNPYRYLEVRGRVIEITETGADEHINKLAKKYLDKDVYPFRQPGEVRLFLRVELDRVRTYGG